MRYLTAQAVLIILGSAGGHILLFQKFNLCRTFRGKAIVFRLLNGPRDKARLGSIPDVSRGLPLHFTCRMKLEGLGTRLIRVGIILFQKI